VQEQAKLRGHKDCDRVEYEWGELAVTLVCYVGG